MVRELALLFALALVTGASGFAEETTSAVPAAAPALSADASASAAGEAVALSLSAILGSGKSWVCEPVCGTYYAACAEDCTEEGCYSRGCGYPNGWSQGTCSCSYCF